MNESAFEKFRRTHGNENCGTMDYTRLAFEYAYNLGIKSTAPQVAAPAPEPRVVYQVYCPVCSMSLIYSRAMRAYNHPAGEVYCPNQHKDFSVEQPTVREVKAGIV